MRAMESSRELGERSENTSRSDPGTSWYGWRRLGGKFGRWTVVMEMTGHSNTAHVDTVMENTS